MTISLMLTSDLLKVSLYISFIYKEKFSHTATATSPIGKINRLTNS